MEGRPGELATDYEALADAYDRNPMRHAIDPEPALASLARSIADRPVDVLDVGCGTGNWLAVQRGAFGERATLRGVEPSGAMRARAEAKLPGVAVVEGSAEALPFADASVDLCVSTFAYHHFVDLPRALGELARVTRPGGTVLLRNVCPQRMQAWFVYRFFPSTVAIDAARFPTPERLFELCEGAGLKPRVEVRSSFRRVRLDELLPIARLREMSELALASDAEHEAGCRALEEALAADPDASVIDEMAILTLHATK